MTNSNARLAVDLDDIERQLRENNPVAGQPKKDPLAELARIVGQDDPFRASSAMEGSGRGASSQPAHSLAPELRGSLPSHGLDHNDTSYGNDPTERRQTDAKGAMVDVHGQGQFDAPYRSPDEYDAYPVSADHTDGYDNAGLHHQVRPRSRKSLVIAGALLGVSVLGVAGTLLLRNGGGGSGNHGPLVVQADKNPLKIQPENPGGVDIPNQNKQIYERGSGDGQTRVVNREEQPLDVQQATRAAAQASVAAPGNASARGPSLSSNNSLTSGLGEPKRVRTVSVPIQELSGAARQPGAATTTAASGSTPQASATPAPPPRPVAPPVVAPARPAANTEQLASATPQAAPESPRTDQRPAQRVAAAPKAASALEPAGTGSTAAAGGFAVQLAVRPSEKEARTAYQQLQQRFADDLNGRSPAIRSAQVNGKTIYRVRIGPMSRDDASNLCSKLKTSGGQCFVANN